MGRAEFTPDGDIGIYSARLLRDFESQLYAGLTRSGFDDLAPRHGTVFAYLDATGTRATDLASRASVHKQVIGNLVDELESLGYVTRAVDPTDRRAKLVVPTQRGLERITAASHLRQGIEARYRAAIGAAEYAALVAGLRTLTDALGGSRPS